MEYSDHLLKHLMVGKELEEGEGAGNIPIEGRTVDGRERETESVTRKEVKKIQVWSKVPEHTKSRQSPKSKPHPPFPPPHT
ncbi:hypothetical protein E3U43_021577 [Larimichthys crocea]|uniref:Uncharacterized protein n=1 Tax=Larimichthys crocea TaxID=215358 RepID=A0ACD3R6W9_LARCR|nr:hypothetical protein E3U43_021577 [Larimichthys crocea]